MHISFYKKVLLLCFLPIFSVSAMELDPLSDEFKKLQLEEYLEKSEEYKVFKAAHKIVDILEECQKKVADKVADVELFDIKSIKSTDSSYFASYYTMTNRGLFLAMECDRPDHLCMPWGRIDLRKADGHLILGNICVMQEFLKRVKVSLAYDRPYQSTIMKSEAHCYEVIGEIDQDFLIEKVRKLISLEAYPYYGCHPNEEVNKIQKDLRDYNNKVVQYVSPELHSYVGTEKLVVCNSHNYFLLYQIVSVDGEDLPKTEWTRFSPTQDIALARNEAEKKWEIMKERYQRELANAKL